MVDIANCVDLLEPSTFNPAEWLKRFEAVGGAYMGSGETLKVCWAIADWTEAENMEARRLYRILDDDLKWKALTDFINARMPQEGQS